MNRKRLMNIAMPIIGTIVAVIVVYNIYLYSYVLRDASQYPSTVMDDMVVYSINPETSLEELNDGKTDIFMPALKTPIYDDVAPSWGPGSFAWEPEDYFKVADALHQKNWNESLQKWKLFSASFDLFQCVDVSRIDHVTFGFYQSHGNWYYLVHNITIDLEYGLIYAGDDDGRYTGRWKDIDFGKAVVDKADKALLIAEQNGGEEARLSLVDKDDCSINIFLAPFVLDQKNWGWRVTYESGKSFIYDIVIDPYTGEFDLPNSSQ
jgi:hypothetical protein